VLRKAFAVVRIGLLARPLGTDDTLAAIADAPGEDYQDLELQLDAASDPIPFLGTPLAVTPGPSSGTHDDVLGVGSRSD
jgi:hypothetical protein